MCQFLFSRRWRCTLFVAMAAIALSIASFGPLAAQGGEPIEKYTATAPVSQTPLEIEITRWTTWSQRSELLKVLKYNDPQKTIEALREQEKTGFVSTSTSLRYDLYYAVKFPAGDKRHVIMVTDRPVSFQADAPTPDMSLEHAMTILDLMIDSDGTGTGVIVLGAGATMDEATGRVEVVTAGQAPIHLENVRVVE